MKKAEANPRGAQSLALWLLRPTRYSAFFHVPLPRNLISSFVAGKRRCISGRRSSGGDWGEATTENTSALAGQRFGVDPILFSRRYFERFLSGHFGFPLSWKPQLPWNVKYFEMSSWGFRSASVGEKKNWSEIDKTLDFVLRLRNTTCKHKSPTQLTVREKNVVVNQYIPWKKKMKRRLGTLPLHHNSLRPFV